MITRVYYTIEDLYDADSLTNNFNKLFSQWLGAYTDTAETTKLYQDIEDNFYDDYILYIDISHPSYEIIEKPDASDLLIIPDYNSQVVRQMKKIRAWLNDSKEKYAKLIQLYQANEGKLMDQLKSESSVQFNDTPQVPLSGGLDADDYATTYTKTKAQTDVGTVMARLIEVRDNWSNLYERWTAEFSKKFIIY